MVSSPAKADAAPDSASVSAPATSAKGTAVDVERASGAAVTPTVKPNGAGSVGVSVGGSFAVGVAALMWQAL